MGDVLRLHGLGAAVDVHLTGVAAGEVGSAMRRAWTRCLTPHDPGLQVIEAEALTVHLDDAALLGKTLMVTTQRVTRALIGARAGDLLLFHAGAVSDPDTGRSLAYVARGGTGKTTLSRLLGKRLGYLTDETVGIDAAGLIHPYPKPLSVRRADQPDLKDELSPDALGLLPAPATARLRRIVLLERGADVDTATLAEVDFMDALFALAAQSSALPALPRPLHRLADLIDEVGPILTLRYGEAGHVADGLGSLVQAAP